MYEYYPLLLIEDEENSFDLFNVISLDEEITVEEDDINLPFPRTSYIQGGRSTRKTRYQEMLKNISELELEPSKLSQEGKLLGFIHATERFRIIMKDGCRTEPLSVTNYDEWIPYDCDGIYTIYLKTFKAPQDRNKFFNWRLLVRIENLIDLPEFIKR